MPKRMTKTLAIVMLAAVMAVTAATVWFLVDASNLSDPQTVASAQTEREGVAGNPVGAALATTKGGYLRPIVEVGAVNPVGAALATTKGGYLRPIVEVGAGNPAGAALATTKGGYLRPIVEVGAVNPVGAALATTSGGYLRPIVEVGALNHPP